MVPLGHLEKFAPHRFEAFSRPHGGRKVSNKKGTISTFGGVSHRARTYTVLYFLLLSVSSLKKPFRLFFGAKKARRGGARPSLQPFWY